MFPIVVCAAEADLTLIIKEHRFQPSELVIPVGKKVKILIVNQDSTPEEFESHSLNREKVIAANSSASIYVGPLDAGSYKFFGEFNEATAQGVIIAK
jgi:hypothetical protein